MSGAIGQYWEERYALGGDSGVGSRGRNANKKAAFVNRLINEQGVRTLVDWGCGDGRVASKISVFRYIGLDVSPTAVERCRAVARHRRWHFLLYDGIHAPEIPAADMALSLDVIFHLTDDAIYRRYLELLFASAPLVCIHSSNRDETGRAHVSHRRFVDDIPPEWETLISPPEDGEGRIGFWVFSKKGQA